MNYTNFNEITKYYDVLIQIHTPNDPQKTWQQQTLSAPRFVIEQQYISLMEQAMHAPFPVKVIMRRTDKEWNQYEGRMIDMEYSVVYANQQYLESYPDEFENQE